MILDGVSPLTPTETKILEAFLKLSIEIGVSNVTLDKVASKAKVAFGTVRYHFAGQKKLNLEQAAVIYVFYHGYRFLEDYMSINADPKGLESYIKGNFEWFNSHSAHSSYLLYFYYLEAIGAKLPFHHIPFRVKPFGLFFQSFFHQ